MEQLAKIPKGNTKEDVYVRRAIIVTQLADLKGKSVPCMAVTNKRVEFVFDSIDETATKASKNYLSTLAALRVVEALKTAKFVKNTNVVSTKQRKMKFTRMIVLRNNLSGIGEVKILVGEIGKRKVLHYSITKKATK